MSDPKTAPSRTAPKTPANSRPRRRRRSLIGYRLRIAGVILAGALGAWGLFALLSKIAHPYQLGYREEQKVAALKADLQATKKEIDTLTRRVAYLSSPQGREYAARRAGYHKHGETVYLLAPSALATPHPSPSPP